MGRIWNWIVGGGREVYEVGKFERKPWEITPVKPLFIFFRLFLGLFFIIIGLGIIVGFFIIVIPTIFNIGEAQAKTGIFQMAADKLTTVSEKVGLVKVTEYITTKTRQAFLEPEKLMEESFESEIDESQDKEVGVKITKLEKIQKGQTLENTPIELMGTITASPLNEDLEVSAYCTMEGYKNENGELALIPANFKTATNKVTIIKGFPETLLARCSFEKGAQIPGFLGGEKTKIGSRKARMIVQYEFTSKALHKTYYMDSNEKALLLRTGKNPFQYYKVTEPLLQSDNRVRSKVSKGPVNLGIGTYESQPFAEDEEHLFGVSVKNNLGWFGNLQKINYLELRVPQEISLEGDIDFQTLTSSCAFEDTGNIDEENNKIYRLKNEFLAKVNKDCSEKALKGTIMKQEECINTFKNNLVYTCSSKLIESPGEGIKYYPIKAIINYIYQIEEPIQITIYPKPEEAPSLA